MSGMTALRTGRIWRLHRLVIGSPHTHRGRACRDSAPGSRRSCADGVSPPLRRTKRTSKPPRKLLLRICRKARRRAFRRRVSSPPRASSPCKSRRRRPPRRARIRSAGTSRPPPARACASPPARAPCADGFRDFGRRMRLPPLGLRRIGRVGSPGPSQGRIRTDCAPAREESFRTADTDPARVGRRCVCGGVRDRMRVWFPDPCVAWFPPCVIRPTDIRRRDVLRAGVLPRGLPHRHSIRAHTRCSPHN